VKTILKLVKEKEKEKNGGEWRDGRGDVAREVDVDVDVDVDWVGGGDVGM